MKFKANVPNTAPMSPRDEVERKYRNCRANLLMVVLFTVFNLVTYPFVSFYFPFAATIPCYEMHLTFQENPEVAFAELLIPIIIGIILTVPYLLCWIFSKKRVGWMVAALVFFSLDCLLLIAMYDLTSVIVDILFHAWVMFYLITGVIHGFKLKSMPEDEPLPNLGAAEGETPAEDGFGTFNEADFTYTADNTAPAEETAAEAETAEEPVAARSFDEIMAENNEDGQ